MSARRLRRRLAMTRSILFVCHFDPPSTGAGVHRPVTMAKYLRRMGHRVTILTTGAYGRMPEEADSDVVRTYDLQLLAVRLRGGSKATGILESDVYSNRPHPLSYVVVPEVLALAWTPFAVARALRLARERRFDCVVTTSPPESTHAVGYALSRRLGVPWVADVRDGWTFESYRPPWPTRAQARLDGWLERRAMRTADVVTSVAPSIVGDFRERVGANARLVPNGWDPELAAYGDGSADGILDPTRISILHTGRMAVVGRDPSPLVRALSELAEREPELAARLELVFAGSLTPAERNLLASVREPAQVTLLGNVSRSRALALQRAADVLLLLTAGTRQQEVTGKLFEYLATGRPILAVAKANANDGARILRETGGGIVIPPGDRDAARHALRRAATGDVPAPRPNAAAAYGYPGMAELMAEAIEAAIAARRAGAVTPPPARSHGIARG
jgi:glycosyltransferase involved in cell wall biosynthesis